MSAALALRFSLLALALSVICFAVHGAATWLHAPVPLPPRALTLVGVFGMTWPLWAYAAALYRRARSAK